MTMKKNLEAMINGIRTDSKIPVLDEASARLQVIDPALLLLGWVPYSPDFVREYRVPGGGLVDYALLVDGEPKVFVEAKRPSEHLADHQDQLVTYSAKRGVPLAVLTNGLNWWLYLPLKEGEFETRRFCELDIAKQDVSEVCDRLIEFLSRESVYSGTAVENAEAHLKQLQDARRVDEVLPHAWKALVAGPDDLLVELINERVKGLCGVEAAPERIKGFLEGLGKPEPPPNSGNNGTRGEGTDDDKSKNGSAIPYKMLMQEEGCQIALRGRELAAQSHDPKNETYNYSKAWYNCKANSVHMTRYHATGHFRGHTKTDKCL